MRQRRFEKGPFFLAISVRTGWGDPRGLGLRIFSWQHSGDRSLVLDILLPWLDVQCGIWWLQ